MTLRTAALLLCFLVPVLPACSDSAAPPPAQPPAEAPAPAAPATTDAAPGTPAADPTRGGDGSPIALLPLEPAHAEAVDLPGELACGLIDANGATLLLARADVQPDGMVRALVNHAGHAEVLANARAGGFNDLLDGITLTGTGLTATIARGAAEYTGNESTRHAAMLTVERADGAERRYAGMWTCGP